MGILLVLLPAVAAVVAASVDDAASTLLPPLRLYAAIRDVIMTSSASVAGLSSVRWRDGDTDRENTSRYWSQLRSVREDLTDSRQ
jgi:hypothetical protein